MQSVMSDDLGQIEDEFLFELSKLVFKHGKPERVVGQIEAVVNACSSDGFREYNQKLCQLLGDLHAQHQMNTKAYVSDHAMIELENVPERDAHGRHLGNVEDRHERSL